MLHPQAGLHDAALPAQRDALLSLLGASPVVWEEIALLVANDPVLLYVLLRAAPLERKRLGENLHDEIRLRLEQAGPELLSAWLISRSRAHATPSRTDVALRGFSQRTAVLAHTLAIESDYPHRDEARLVGLWSRLAQILRLELGHDASQTAPIRAINARLADECGCAPPLADALTIAEGTEEQARNAHPLAAILWSAMRLAMQEDDESIAAIERVTGIDSDTLCRIRNEAPAELPVPMNLFDTTPNTADEPGKSLHSTGTVAAPSHALVEAALDGLARKAFDGLDEPALRTRFQTAARLLCGIQPGLVVTVRDGLLQALPLIDDYDISDCYQELAHPLDDEASVLALAVRSHNPTSYRRDDSGIPGRSVRDWQLAHWLGRGGFVCLPFRLAHTSGAIVIASEQAQIPAADATRLLVMLAQAAATVASAQQERRDLENALLARIEQRYRDHARRIAHEARNPLSVIRSYLQLIPQRHDASGLEEELRILHDEIDRLGTLIDASTSPPEEPSEPAFCHVTELLHDMRAMVGESLFEKRGIHFELRTMAGLPPVAMPASALRQVILNLLHNAADILHPGGRCTVALAGELIADGVRCIEIRVIDNGPGLPIERQSAPFSPQRSNKGGRHEGLGLAITYEILSQWHARILCRSQSSVGTSFQLLVPVMVSG